MRGRRLQYVARIIYAYIHFQYLFFPQHVNATVAALQDISQACQSSGSLLVGSTLWFEVCCLYTHGSSSKTSRSLVCTQNALSDLNSKAYSGWLSSCLCNLWERWKNIRESWWRDLQTACASVLASRNTSAFRAKYCCHLIKWYFTYLIRIHTSNIKYRPLFKTTSVSNYCRNVCSNFWSICGNIAWYIMFPQG